MSSASASRLSPQIPAIGGLSGDALVPHTSAVALEDGVPQLGRTAGAGQDHGIESAQLLLC
jgi:hypothetical protein